MNAQSTILIRLGPHQGPQPRLRPWHHGLRSLQNHIAIAIVATSAVFVCNFPRYQGPRCNHNRNLKHLYDTKVDTQHKNSIRLITISITCIRNLSYLKIKMEKKKSNRDRCYLKLSLNLLTFVTGSNWHYIPNLPFDRTSCGNKPTKKRIELWIPQSQKKKKGKRKKGEGIPDWVATWRLRPANRSVAAPATADRWWEWESVVEDRVLRWEEEKSLRHMVRGFFDL